MKQYDLPDARMWRVMRGVEPPPGPDSFEYPTKLGEVVWLLGEHGALVG